MQNQTSQTKQVASQLSLDTSAVTTALTDAGTQLTSLGTALQALQNIPTDKLAEMKTGADQLNAASATATSGLTESNTKLTAAATAAKQIADGATTLSNSSTTLVNGISQLQVGGTALADGTKTLNDSSSTLSSGASQISSGASTLDKNSAALNSGASQVSSGLSQVSSKIPTLSDGVTALLTGSKTLAAGTQKLADNGTTITSGASQLQSGATQIASGSGQLATGEEKITTNLGTVKSGLDTLTKNLDLGSKKIKAVNTSSKAANAISTPVKTKGKDTTHVPNNGTAMAPYMMSVALFVGTLTANMMFDAFKPKKRPTSAVAWWFSKMAILGGVAIAAGIIVYVALTAGLGLNPEHPAKVFFFLILESVTYMSIVTLFNVLFGKVGSFLMLIYLLLQLAGSQGTYAIELSSNFFMKISPYLPMTHAISALRQGISMGGQMGTQTLIFVILLIVSNLLMIGFYWFKKKRNPFIKEKSDPETLEI
jgi:putative membrane protein